MAAREARLDVIPSMRRLIAGVCALHRIPQAALASRIGWSAPKLAQFMSGKKNGKDLSRISINSLNKQLVIDLGRANFPASEQALNHEASLLHATAAERHAASTSTTREAAAGAR